MGIFGFGKNKIKEKDPPTQEKDIKEDALDAQKKYVDSIIGNTKNEEVMEEMLNSIPKPLSYNEKTDLIKCMSEEETNRFLKLFNCNREFSKEEEEEFRKLLKKKRRFDEKTKALYAGMEEEEINKVFKYADDINNFYEKESWELENGERAEAEKKMDELPKMERNLDSFLSKFQALKFGLSEKEAETYRILEAKIKEEEFLTEDEKKELEVLSSKISDKIRYQTITEVGMPESTAKEYFTLKNKKRSKNITEEEQKRLEKLENKVFDYSHDANQQLWQKKYEKFGIPKEEVKEWYQLGPKFLGPNRTPEQIKKYDKFDEKLNHLDRIIRIETT